MRREEEVTASSRHDDYRNPRVHEEDFSCEAASGMAILLANCIKNIVVKLRNSTHPYPHGRGRVSVGT